MFKAICEKVGLTKSNLRRIVAIVIEGVYPDLGDSGEQGCLVLAVAFALSTLVLGRNLYQDFPLAILEIFVLALCLFWALRVVIFLVPSLIISLIEKVWEEIPEEGRKKKREEEAGEFEEAVASDVSSYEHHLSRLDLK